MTDTPPLYARLARHYREAIASGALAPGSAMPSVRALVRLHRVSVSTALQACRRLEDEGLLEARPRAGYFVRDAARSSARPLGDAVRAARVPDAESWRGIHDRVSRHVALSERHPARVDFGATYATPDAYPAAALRTAATRALREDPDLMVRPIPPKGDASLRAALARRALDAGMRVSPEEIIVTQGCTEALNIALRAVTSPGDLVAVESPTFFGLLQVIESLGLRALEIPTDPRTGFSVTALEFALTGGWPAAASAPGASAAPPPDPVRAVVVSPVLQNPTGAVMPEAEQQRLVRLCAAHGVALVEDDTYGPLLERDDGGPIPSLKRWDAAGGVIHCASLRKTIAPGVRLGWMTGGRWQARLEMLKYVQSRANEALSQQAMAVFLASGACDRHLARLRRTLRERRTQVAAALARHFPAGTRVTRPPGGMMLWVELPDASDTGLDAEALFTAALSDGIRITPGSLFTNSDRHRHDLRISCGHAFDTEVDHALRRLGELLRRPADSTADPPLP